MRWAFALLGLVVCCGAASARAQDEADARTTCKWDSAEPVSVAQITAHFRDWQGKCVRVKALHSGARYGTANRLLSDRMAVLEHGEPRQRSIVLLDRFETSHDRHRPRWEEVLGTVGSCELAYEAVAAMQAARPGTILMLTGPCHYTLDHFLVPLAYRDVPRQPAVRLRRSELAPEQVELRELGPAHPIYSLRRESGKRMFAALEQDDLEAFIALDNPEVARDRAEHGEGALGDGDRKRLADSRRDFGAAVAAFRASGIRRAGREIMLFERWVDDGEDADTEQQEDADPRTEAYWCRLREGAGDADLPVHADDIDNDPSRPFFCVLTSDYVIFREGTVPTASVPLFGYGFREM